jgi:hypothetical protein
MAIQSLQQEVLTSKLFYLRVCMLYSRVCNVALPAENQTDQTVPIRQLMVSLTWGSNSKTPTIKQA